MVLLSFFSSSFFVVFFSCPSLFLLTPALLLPSSFSLLFSSSLLSLRLTFLPLLIVFGDGIVMALFLYAFLIRLCLIVFLLASFSVFFAFLTLFFPLCTYVLRFFISPSPPPRPLFSNHRPPVALVPHPLTCFPSLFLILHLIFFPICFGDTGTDSGVRRESKKRKHFRRKCLVFVTICLTYVFFFN